MNKKFFTYFKEHKNIIIVSLTVFFIIVSSLFFITYNSKENKTKRYLKNISKQIDTINSNVSSCIKDLTIDTNASKEVLTNDISEFNDILKSISEVEEISPDISLIKSSLSNIVNSTIDLYSNSLAIISDPKSIRTTDDLNKFNTFKENCLLEYSNLENNGIKLKYSEDSLKFFDNFYNYLNTLIKINRDSDFNNTQKREFINVLSSFNDDFSYLNQDLTLAINKVREDNRDLNVIIDDIFSKEDSFNNLKERLASISIPDGCMDIYESLNEYLNTYSIYIQAIKEAVICEKTSTNSKDSSEDIDKNYKNSSSKMDDVLESFSNYEDKIKNLY